MKKIKSLSILIIAAMLLALICPITSNAATTIQFEDSELAGQVQKFLGDKATISGSTVTITDESVLANTSTQLDVVLSNCKSLKGLETFMQKASKVEGVRFQLNAENFNLDLSPLKSATNLKHLTISGSNKTTTLNISGLSGLTKVETLVMSHVSIDQKVVEEISNMKGLKSSTGSVWNSKKVFINYSSNIICTTSETADSNGNVKISLPRYLVDPIRYHKDHKDIFTTDNGISCEVVPTDKATLTIVDDDKNPSVTVTAPLKELQSGNVKIKIAGLGSIASLTDRPISDSTISFKYVKTALKVDVKKDPTTKDAEKVKVTITANKELDPDKIPNGWTLGKDGKTLTKDFDKNEIYFTYGRYGSTDSELIKYTVNKNVIEGSYIGILDSYNAITVKINLPNKYFSLGFIGNLPFIIPIILTLVSIIIFLIKGINKRKEYPVEYLPPKGLNSLDVSYIY